MSLAPSEINTPSEVSGSWTPSPKKDRKLSSKITFGISSVIGEGVESVGGRSTVSSIPQGGTRVTLNVPTTAYVPARSVNSMSPLRAVGVPMVSAFTLFTAYSALVTWNFAQRPAVNVLALALFVSTAAVLLFASQERRYTWMPSWVCAMALVLVPAMMLVEVQAQAVRNPLGDWTSEVSAVFLFVIVATGPRWTGPLAIIAWLVGQEWKNHVKPMEFRVFFKPGLTQRQSKSRIMVYPRVFSFY